MTTSTAFIVLTPFIRFQFVCWFWFGWAISIIKYKQYFMFVVDFGRQSNESNRGGMAGSAERCFFCLRIYEILWASVGIDCNSNWWIGGDQRSAIDWFDLKRIKLFIWAICRYFIFDWDKTVFIGRWFEIQNEFTSSEAGCLCIDETKPSKLTRLFIIAILFRYHFNELPMILLFFYLCQYWGLWMRYSL